MDGRTDRQGDSFVHPLKILLEGGGGGVGTILIKFHSDLFAWY